MSIDACLQPQKRSLKNRLSHSPFPEKIATFESGTERAALEATADCAGGGVIQAKMRREKTLKTIQKWFLSFGVFETEKEFHV
jgi:hypothetical protein